MDGVCGGRSPLTLRRPTVAKEQWDEETKLGDGHITGLQERLKQVAI